MFSNSEHHLPTYFLITLQVILQLFSFNFNFYSQYCIQFCHLALVYSHTFTVGSSTVCSTHDHKIYLSSHLTVLDIFLPSIQSITNPEQLPLFHNSFVLEQPSVNTLSKAFWELSNAVTAFLYSKPVIQPEARSGPEHCPHW